MGLDMYLYKNTWLPFKDEERARIAIVGLPDIKMSRVRYVVEEIGYWRKANAIHRWFVNNVQDGVDDCKHYYVSKVQLKELLELVKEVKENPDDAEELLPTTSGFFFGSTAYDEFYKEDLERTIGILEEAIASDYCEIYYHSSW